MLKQMRNVKKPEGGNEMNFGGVYVWTCFGVRGEATRLCGIYFLGALAKAMPLSMESLM
jgi:hypothetical protein